MIKNIILTVLITISATASFAQDMMVEYDGEMYTLTKHVEEEHHGWEFNVDGEYNADGIEDTSLLEVTPTIAFTEGFTLLNGFTFEGTLTKGYTFTNDGDYGTDTAAITTLEAEVSKELFGIDVTIEGTYDFEAKTTEATFNFNKQW